MEVPGEKQEGKIGVFATSPKNIGSFATSPQNNGSNLYDSYELQAVLKQLNRAIRGSKDPLSPSSYYLKSPGYRRRLDNIYKENAKAPRKITGSQIPNIDHEMKTSARCSKGLPQLWKKVKQRFVVRNK